MFLNCVTKYTEYDSVAVMEEMDHSYRSTRRKYLSATAAIGGLAIASGTASACDEKDKKKDDEKRADERREELDKFTDGVESEDTDPTEIDSPTVITEPGAYVITEDIETDLQRGEACIFVKSDNVTIDGRDNTLRGGGSGAGIFVLDSTNVRVRNCNIENFLFGVTYFEAADDGVVDGCTVTNCTEGIGIDDATDNVVRNCTLRESKLVVEFDSIGTVLINNEITDVSDRNGVSLADSSRCYVIDNKVTGSEQSGLFCDSVITSTISGNEFTGNGAYGIELDFCEDNRITDNDLSDNEDGACNLENSDANLFRGNDPACGPDE